MSTARVKKIVWMIIAVACVGSAALIATLFWMRSRSPHPEHAYQIRAESLREWKAYGGRWSIEGDSIHNDSDERGAKFITGSARWTDYTLQADLRFDGDHGDMGVIVRSSDEEEGVDAYNGYYAGLRTGDGTLVIGRADYGWLEARPVVMPGGVHASDWYRLTITTFGCFIAAESQNLTTHASARVVLEEHPCAASGRIGLRSVATGGRWRNIVVRRASEADYLHIRQHVAASSAPEFPKREADYNGLRPIPASPALLRDSAAPRASTALAEPTRHIGDLLELSRSSLEHVVLRGVVTLSRPSLFVQDSTGGILVRTRGSPVLNVGDVVELRGRVVPGLFSSEIDADDLRHLWSVTPLPPISITPSQAASGTYDARYVEVEGHVVEPPTSVDGMQVLTLSDGVHSFRALGELRANDHRSRIAKDSYVRVRGICELDQRYTRGLTPFVVLLGSADDVQVLANAPWWNLRHLTFVFSGVLLSALLLQVLYFRVQRWKAETITRERERLAHEIHDTMAQGFAGIGYQIQGIRHLVKQKEHPDSARVSEQLNTAYQLVRRCHEEASRTISMLAEPSPGIQDNLISSLQEAAVQMTNDQVRISSSVEGTPVRLRLRVANALMHIGREAIANAASHGQPSELMLILRFGQSDVDLVVRDNGHGFRHGTDTAGFGILGMQKRAREIGGTLQILSTPGEGTEVCVRAGLRSEAVFERTVQTLKRRLTG